MYNQLSFINNQSNQSFELMVDGRRSFIDYKMHGDVYLLIHTEVPEDLQGQGIAAILVNKTFEYLEANQLKMKPYCAYIKGYLEKYPDWKRLIAN